MQDYTSEGIRERQIEIGVSTLHLIDKKMKKANRYLKILTVVGLVSLAFKFKAFRSLLDTKGE